MHRLRCGNMTSFGVIEWKTVIPPPDISSCDIAASPCDVAITSFQRPNPVSGPTTVALINQQMAGRTFRPSNQDGLSCPGLVLLRELQAA